MNVSRSRKGGGTPAGPREGCRGAGTSSLPPELLGFFRLQRAVVKHLPRPHWLTQTLKALKKNLLNCKPFSLVFLPFPLLLGQEAGSGACCVLVYLKTKPAKLNSCVHRTPKSVDWEIWKFYPSPPHSIQLKHRSKESSRPWISIFRRFVNVLKGRCDEEG